MTLLTNNEIHAKDLLLLLPEAFFLLIINHVVNDSPYICYSHRHNWIFRFSYHESFSL